ncbi:hypothetical protein FOS14_00205 [Skermania sp. ID1734]|uniref:hypothetical protein n=1 Tax=Skermania sp. ID1734 TaxID=2597516 RepID=UPI001181709C|nr:hypothetical protein [Skermania sp. ID1734]TSE01859.1 hypothetical protein FOS14_00205 [Skermania sp. ID1734]
MASTVSKSLWWVAFLAGLVNAGLGIADLHVGLTVFGLIVASTAGLVLLKIRAEALGRLDGLDGLESVRRPRAMAGSISMSR